jgi:cell wall-associated NlpC family hydrolase
VNQAACSSIRAAIVAEARSWLHTPYHHHGRIKGAGVDCAMLLAEVFEAVQLVPHVDAGVYPHDWHLHRSEERFLGWLERCGARETGTPDVGDVALFRYGRAYSHGAILTRRSDMAMVHAYIGLGVIESRSTEEPLVGRPCRYFTLLGAGA